MGGGGGGRGGGWGGGFHIDRIKIIKYDKIKIVRESERERGKGETDRDIQTNRE